MAKRFNRNDLEVFHDYELFVPTRTIYLGSLETDMEGNESGTDAAMAERLIKNMIFLEHLSKDPITIIANNLGGSWCHGMAIYDTICASECHITVKGVGHIMSMGSIILQAADERVAMPNATIMIHDGYESLSGTPKTVEAWAKEAKANCQKMYEIYASKSHKPMKYWEKKCSTDFILTAQQALELGLIDRIEPPPEA